MAKLTYSTASKNSQFAVHWITLKERGVDYGMVAYVRIFADICKDDDLDRYIFDACRAAFADSEKAIQEFSMRETLPTVLSKCSCPPNAPQTTLTIKFQIGVDYSFTPVVTKGAQLMELPLKVFVPNGENLQPNEVDYYGQMSANDFGALHKEICGNIFHFDDFMQ